MKNITSSSLVIVSSLILSGCAHVPATKITFDPVSHTLNLSSPKDIAISNLVAEVKADGSAKITVEGYSSRNNVEVIAAVAKANAESQALAAKAGADIIGAAVNAAK